MPDTFFDEASANRICQWFEEILIPPEVGHPVPLQPWLRDVLRKAYGTKNADGTRTVRTLYLFLPKKNSKSFILSGLALYHLCADFELSAECICCAGTAKQAGLVFDASKTMAKCPDLKTKIKPFRSTLVHAKSGSKFSVIPADAETAEGPKCSFIAFDELHVQKTRKLWDTLRGSGLSRKQPMTVVATTAGDNKTGIAWEVHDYACRVRDGKRIDPTFLPVIFGADEGDDPNDPNVWKKCNPSWGVTFTPQDFENIYTEAKSAGPARFSSWQRYHLNRWQTSVTAWLPMDRWAECGKKKVDPKALVGRSCFPGIDLSSTTDLTACCLLFPDGDGYQVLAYHWMPRGRVIDAELRDQVPYRQWSAGGWGEPGSYLELTEGNAIDQRLIFRRVMELHAKYPFANRQVRLDDYNAPTFVQDIAGAGLIPVPVSPKARGISAPAKELLRLVCDAKLYHGDNPLLNWQAGICDVVQDEDQNIRPFKGKGEARKRIDGILATCYALSGAMLNKTTPDAPRQSVYSSRGIFSL